LLDPPGELVDRKRSGRIELLEPSYRDGRPSGLTVTRQRILVKAAGAGLSSRTACKIAGVSPSSFYRFWQRCRTDKPAAHFVAAFEQARAHRLFELAELFSRIEDPREKMLTRQKYIVHGRLKKNGDVRRVPGTPVSYERTLKHKKPPFAVMKKYIHKLFSEPEPSR